MRSSGEKRTHAEWNKSFPHFHNFIPASLLNRLHAIRRSKLCSLEALDLDGGEPGAQAWWEAPCVDTESLGRGWSMKIHLYFHGSLIFIM